LNQIAVHYPVMSIEAKKVHAILLSDGWHQVEPGTFTFARQEFIITSGSKTRRTDTSDLSTNFFFLPTGICPYWFQCIESSSRKQLHGPLTAVHAMRTNG
jgi:hypothetical protein